MSPYHSRVCVAISVCAVYEYSVYTHLILLFSVPFNKLYNIIIFIYHSLRWRNVKETLNSPSGCSCGSRTAISRPLVSIERLSAIPTC